MLQKFIQEFLTIAFSEVTNYHHSSIKQTHLFIFPNIFIYIV